MVWPSGLAVLYPLEKAVTDGWLLAAFALIALSILSIWAAQRRPYILVGWFWYVGTLVPVIGLIQVGRQASADRYTYVPLIGLFLIVAFGLTDALASSRSRSLALATAGGLAIAACMWMTRTQLTYWSSSRALWERTLDVTGDNAFGHFTLAVAFADEGKTDEARHHYSEALRIEPNFPEAHDRIGVFYLSQGKVDEAITHFSQAIRLKPNYAVAHNNLGSAFGNQGRIEEAISEYTEAVRLNPGYADAHINLGILLADRGKTNEAIGHFSEVLRINPADQDARAWLTKLTSEKATTQ
jgi:tetratricopeptide (TPR) repeat protein